MQRSSLSQLLYNVRPFVLFGVAIAAGFAVLILMSYLFLWGLVFAAILGAISFISQKFRPHRPRQHEQVERYRETKEDSEGRIIDHDTL